MTRGTAKKTEKTKAETIRESNRKRAEGAKINRLKPVLAEHDIAQKELAARLGVSVTTMASWCNNITQPNLVELWAAARILNVSVRDLLYDTPVK